MLNDLYLAGLFDGEGYITINIWDKPNSIHVRYQLIVGINMSYRPIIEMIHQQFGGKLAQNRHDLRNPKQRVCFQWIIASGVAADFLKRILPHMIVKKDEAELALKFQDHVDAYKYKTGNMLRNNPNRDSILAERRDLADQIRALKKTNFLPLTDSGPKVSELSLTR